MFDERKAAEAAAFLLYKAEGELPLIKLVKLMYMAERLSFQRYGEPLTGDRLVSMPHGPVLSMTLNCCNGAYKSREEEGWESWISDRAEHMVALRDRSRLSSPEDDLLSLSDSDLEVLGEVWVNYGHMDRWTLVDYTHTGGCPEWEDPEGSSIPITYQTLFTKLGFSEDQANELVERVTKQNRLDRALAAA